MIPFSLLTSSKKEVRPCLAASDKCITPINPVSTEVLSRETHTNTVVMKRARGSERERKKERGMKEVKR